MSCASLASSARVGRAQSARPVCARSARRVSRAPRAALGATDPESSPSFSVPGASTLEVGDFAKLDLGRTERTGLPEVVWGPGKTPAQILQIMLALRDRQNAVMATRVDPETFDAIRALYDETQNDADDTKTAVSCLDTTGFAVAQLANDPAGKDARGEATPKRVPIPGVLVVLTAGTADLAVAQEAATTARAMGVDDVRVVADVGVAGLQRLLSRLDAIREADVLLVVAGMDGALPSVVAGLVDAPVVALPTSFGYGAAMGGLSRLAAALNSCATGVVAVNIDNGFGAAMAAVKMLRAAARLAARGG